MLYGNAKIHEVNIMSDRSKILKHVADIHKAMGALLEELSNDDPTIKHVFKDDGPEYVNPDGSPRIHAEEQNNIQKALEKTATSFEVSEDDLESVVLAELKEDGLVPEEQK